MAAPSAPNDGRLSALNPLNLRSLESSKDDKSHSLHSYIRSQKVHLSAYAHEGRNQSPADVLDAAQPEANRKRLRDVDLESGFGTPLLKPRKPAKHSRTPTRAPAIIPVARSSLDDQRVGAIDDAIEEEGRRRMPSKRAAKENTTTRPKRAKDIDSVDGGRSPKRLRQADIQDFTEPVLSAKHAASRSKNKRKPSEREQEPMVESSQKHTMDIEHRNRTPLSHNLQLKDI